MPASRVLGAALTSFLAAFVSGAAGDSWSAVANPVSTDTVTATLLAERTAVVPGDRFRLGLTLDVRDGWHVYWQNPGDSGLPPVLDWTLPDGVTVSDVMFPIPKRIPYGPLMNFGYEGQITFPLSVELPPSIATDTPLRFQVRADWLVCADICIPESAELALSLPVSVDGPRNDATGRAALDAAMAHLPRPIDWPAQVSVSADWITVTMTLPEDLPGTLHPEAYFPLAEGVIENAAAQDIAIADGVLSIGLVPGYQAQSGIASLDGVLVFETGLGGPDGRIGYLVRPVMATDAAGPLPTVSGGGAAHPNLWSIDSAGLTVPMALVLALLGGILLNLMPCVFPVLFLKALGLVETAQNAPWQVRLHGLVFAGGVLLSFLVIGGAWIALLAGGASIGWGFQLQSPPIVAVLAYLFLLIGLNLSGVFGIGTSIMNVGTGLASRGGYAGSFFTGVLATVVATPCTAPFMGAALGFALTQPPVIALVVFLALGLGMALPYLMLSFLPRLLRLLPKPGAWMERLKQALAFPMYATAAWLLWVLALQAGPDGLAAVLAGGLTLAFAAWVFGLTQTSGGIARAIGTFAALAAVALAAGFVRMTALTETPVDIPGAQAASSRSGSAEAIAWQPFSTQRLTDLTQAGTPVFVNFTAAWCITCLVNERMALRSDSVIAALDARGVVPLKADWTRYDAEITEALALFGRSGVPLYVFYPGGDAAPVVLPQFLTEGSVLSVLETT